MADSNNWKYLALKYKNVRFLTDCCKYSYNSVTRKKLLGSGFSNKKCKQNKQPIVFCILNIGYWLKLVRTEIYLPPMSKDGSLQSNFVGNNGPEEL